METVIEYRHYARAKAQYEAACEDGAEAVKRLGHSELFELVRAHEIEIREQDVDDGPDSDD